MSDLEESRIWRCSFEDFRNMSGFFPCLRKRVIISYLDLEFWDNLCNHLCFIFLSPFKVKLSTAWWNERSDECETKHCFWIPWISNQANKIPTRQFWAEMFEFPLSKLPNTNYDCLEKSCRARFETFSYFKPEKIYFNSNRPLHCIPSSRTMPFQASRNDALRAVLHVLHGCRQLPSLLATTCSMS